MMVDKYLNNILDLIYSFKKYIEFDLMLELLKLKVSGKIPVF